MQRASAAARLTGAAGSMSMKAQTEPGCGVQAKSAEIASGHDALMRSGGRRSRVREAEYLKGIETPELRRPCCTAIIRSTLSQQGIARRLSSCAAGLHLP